MFLKVASSTSLFSNAKVVMVETNMNSWLLKTGLFCNFTLGLLNIITKTFWAIRETKQEEMELFSGLWLMILINLQEP